MKINIKRVKQDTRRLYDVWVGENFIGQIYFCKANSKYCFNRQNFKINLGPIPMGKTLKEIKNHLTKIAEEKIL